MRYLITGHTGFKGAWLALWLAQQGHKVSGLALDPEGGGLFERADVGSVFAHDLRGDVRDAEFVTSTIRRVDPEVIIHLAAQPLVRDSYRRPRWTIETNVMGTLNVLEAASQAHNLAASVVVTTDKVYRNVRQTQGYVESDPLGGDDPYSASKAMADILTHSWVESFPGAPTGIARAGNVIGGGDTGQERLFPDIIRAFQAGDSPVLRSPNSVRPWQHVLDCLNGYLTLTSQLLGQGGSDISGVAWNFGPGEESFVTVGEATHLASQLWGSSLPWTGTVAEYREADLLSLDSGRAKDTLGWTNLLPFEEAVRWTLDWYKSVNHGVSPRQVTIEQLSSFRDLAGG